MANTSSAKKATRKMLRRTEINKSRRSQFKSQVRKVEEALAAGDKVAARSALAVAEPVLVRNARKGVVHKKHRRAQGLPTGRARQSDGLTGVRFGKHPQLQSVHEAVA